MSTNVCKILFRYPCASFPVTLTFATTLTVPPFTHKHTYTHIHTQTRLYRYCTRSRSDISFGQTRWFIKIYHLVSSRTVELVLPPKEGLRQSVGIRNKKKSKT